MNKDNLWQKKFIREEITRFLDDVIESYVSENQHGKEHAEAKARAIVEALESLDYDQFYTDAEAQRSDMDDIRKFAMIESMRRCGGGFVVALAECFTRADSSNFDKLCRAFPEYVEQYLAMAGKQAAQQSLHLTKREPDKN